MKQGYLLLIFLFASFTSLRSQTTVTLSPDRDNTIYSHSGSVSNGAGTGLFIGRTNNGSSTHRTLLHFNLSSLPSNAVIISATLTVEADRFHGTSFSTALHKLNANWGEGTSVAGGEGGGGAAATANDATWTSRFFGTANNWTTAGGDFVSTASATATVAGISTVSYTSAQLAADVQGWVNTASTNNGWILKSVSEAVNGNTARFGSRESATPPQLSITYTVNTPVTLRAFSAKFQRADVVLNWETVTEENNDRFEVQYSTDGSRFSTIGKVKGAGHSTDVRIYSFIHSSPVSSRHFYRLAQVDLDGKINYTSVIMLSSKTDNKLLVNPNPVETLINLSAATTLEGSQFLITTSNGAVVMSGILKGQQLNVATLVPGLYQMSIQTKQGELLRSTFIKR